jgi:hypothetical protein
MTGVPRPGARRVARQRRAAKTFTAAPSAAAHCAAGTGELE